MGATTVTAAAADSAADADLAAVSVASGQEPEATAIPRPWLFALAAMPYGAFNGLVAVALPYILRQHGVSVERIASISAVVASPAIWYFLWAPIVDIGLRRRTWLILLSAVSAVCAAAAVARDGESAARALTVLLVVASVFNQPVSAAVGGLAATVIPDRLRGRTGGWSQAGILGAGIVTGGIGVWLTSHASARVTALVIGLLIVIPSFAALAVDEPSPSKTSLAAQLATVGRDVVATLRRREVWLGLLFFVSPIGASALSNLFSAVARDFHGSTNDVIWVVAAAGVLTPVGALIGGFLCDRFDRWRMYPIAGLAAAASAGAMLLFPLVPATYIAGAAAYSLTTGFCYAAFAALAFELVGSNTAASGTRFTLFMAAVNVPVVYMLKLDGLGHARFGVRGMVAVDAASNAIFGIIFLVAVGRLWKMTRAA